MQDSKKQSPAGVQTMLERNAALLGMTVEQMKSTPAKKQVGDIQVVWRKPNPRFKGAKFTR